MLPKDFFGNQWKTLPVSTLPQSSYSIRSLLWTHQTYNKLAKGSALTKESYARWTTCRPGSNSVVLAWPQMHLLLNLFSIWYIWWPQDTRAWSLEWSSSKVFRQLAIKMHKKCSRKPSASCSYVCYWKYCGFLDSIWDMVSIPMCSSGECRTGCKVARDSSEQHHWALGAG